MLKLGCLCFPSQKLLDQSQFTGYFQSWEGRLGAFFGILQIPMDGDSGGVIGIQVRIVPEFGRFCDRNSSSASRK